MYKYKYKKRNFQLKKRKKSRLKKIFLGIKNLVISPLKRFFRNPKKPKDFYRQQFENPYFKKKPLKKNFKLPSIFSKPVFLVICLVVFSYLLFYSGYFNFKIIELTGAEALEIEKINQTIGEQVNKRIFYILPGSNSLFFSTEDLKHNLISKFGFEKVKIKKSILDNYLKIDVQERKSAIIYCKNDNYYYLDQNGFLIVKVEKEGVNFDFPIIYDQTSAGQGSQLAIDKQVVPQSLAQAVVKIKKQLELSTNIKIISFKVLNTPEILITDRRPPDEPKDANGQQDVEDAEQSGLKDDKKPAEPSEPNKIVKKDYQTDLNIRQLSAISQTGTEMLFGVTLFNNLDNLENLINKLKVLYGQIGPEINNLDYIDLRYGDRIYYK